MSELSVNHLLGIKNITEADIHLIFETADHFKEVINRPIKKVPSLRDITMANLFFENSTRTRLSFESAMLHLGGKTISDETNISPSLPSPGSPLFSPWASLAGCCAGGVYTCA